MIDQAEVERVAKLMHDTHTVLLNEQYARKGLGPVLHPWDEAKEDYKERVRAVARVILADLIPQPLIVGGGA